MKHTVLKKGDLLVEQDTSDEKRTVRKMESGQAAAQAKADMSSIFAVASVSLLVGGIGIMNIMLVTFTERTSEIGIRKALGGKRWDILKQFLFESGVLSALGGILGVLLGVGAAVVVNCIGTFQLTVTLGSVILDFFFSAEIGIFFGFYPAHKAAALDPIEALRYE